MANSSIIYKVVKQKRTWAVARIDNGTIVEGGFFDREAAITACAEWNAGGNAYGDIAPSLK